MILVTSKRRKIGRRYTGVWADDVFYPDQPFVVLRESTFGEWCYATHAGASREEGEQILPSEALFYEVSVD
jgi:hypothetical protein